MNPWAAGTNSITASVILPVYNNEEFLAETLRSISSQTYRDFEVIAIDDGSSDGSFDILQEFARRDKRFIILRRANQGLPATLNECFQRAHSDVIVRMDGDDIMLPHRLERQIDYMQRHPGLTAVTSYAWLVDRNGRFLAESKPSIDVDRGLREADPDCFVNLIDPATILRKRDIQAVGGYATAYSYAEDRELWGRLVASGYRLGVQPEFLLKQRLHASSMTAKSGRQNDLICRFIDHNIVRRLRNRPGLSYEQYLAWRRTCSPGVRFARYLTETSSVMYKRATRDFADRRWWNLLSHASSAVCLNPLWALRMMRRASLGAQPWPAGRNGSVA